MTAPESETEYVVAEEWRKIPGITHEASSLGRIRNAHGKIVPPNKSAFHWTFTARRQAGKRQRIAEGRAS